MMSGQHLKINFDEYKYTIASTHQDLRPDYETKDLSIRKLQYITGEILSDLGIKKAEIAKAGLTVLIAFIVLWLRMAIHYLG